MNQLGQEKAREIAQSGQGYDKIASMLRSNDRGGNMQDEVPAYMGAYEPDNTGKVSQFYPNQRSSETSVPPDWRTQYINDIKQKLSTYPDIQRMFSQLSQ